MRAPSPAATFVGAFEDALALVLGHGGEQRHEPPSHRGVEADVRPETQFPPDSFAQSASAPFPRKTIRCHEPQ
jgi:hypothetical protein